MRTTVALRELVLAALLSGCTTNAAAPAPPSSAAVTFVDALRGGGLYIVMRHGTDTGKDAGAVNVADCTTQAGLRDSGREELRAMAADVVRLGLPIGEVLSSPYCRTLETARIVFGRASPSDVLVRPTGGVPLPSDDARVAALRRMVSTPPSAPGNTVLVTHSEVIRAVLGLDVAVGESIIVRPRGDSFVVLARVGVRGWKAP